MPRNILHIDDKGILSICKDNLICINLYIYIKYFFTVTWSQLKEKCRSYMYKQTHMSHKIEDTMLKKWTTDAHLFLCLWRGFPLTFFGWLFVTPLSSVLALFFLRLVTQPFLNFIIPFFVPQLYHLQTKINPDYLGLISTNRKCKLKIKTLSPRLTCNRHTSA